jgi:MtN3 and saliva related transmembrane protein
MSSGITLVGLVAGMLTTLAFLPQVLKVLRTRSAGDLSFGTFGILGTGVLLWLLYGILMRDLPIILANTLTLVLVLSLLVFMLRYRTSSE